MAQDSLTTPGGGYVSDDAEKRAKVAAMSADAEAKSNAAKFSTPPPPGDPASLRGARDNQYYIGPTNFAKLQQQYTPYQIEQATVRNPSGDIFWNPEKNIASIPPSPSGTTALTPPAEKPPLPSTQGGATPSVTMTTPGEGNELYRAQGAAAGQYLTGIQKTIDDLLARQQADAAKQKMEAEARVTSLTDRLRGTLDKTQYADSLKRDRELFQTEKMIRDLGEVRTRIADATNALNQGIIYEESRPVRMGLLTGRSAELKKQGLAHVGALQATAEIIKGNIELARAYADDSLSAIRSDNAEKNQALNTLLEMENAKLISLTKEEKDAIDERRGLLEKESARLEKDKDALLNLAMKNPNAFTKGNVLFTDTPEQAFQKMSPHLAEMERLELEREMLEMEEIRSRIDENKAQALKAIRGGRAGGGGGGGGGSSASGTNLLSEVASAADLLRNYTVYDLETLQEKFPKAYESAVANQGLSPGEDGQSALMKMQRYMSDVERSQAAKLGRKMDDDEVRRELIKEYGASFGGTYKDQDQFFQTVDAVLKGTPKATPPEKTLSDRDILKKRIEEAELKKKAGDLGVEVPESLQTQASTQGTSSWYKPWTWGKSSSKQAESTPPSSTQAQGTYSLRKDKQPMSFNDWANKKK